MSQEQILKYLMNCLDDLEKLIVSRLRQYNRTVLRPLKLPVPRKHEPGNPLSDFIHNREHPCTPEEYLVMLITIAPHVDPDYFDRIISNNKKDAGDFPIFGGVRGKQFRGILPTGQTCLFLLAGNNLVKQAQIMELFDATHQFSSDRILWLEEIPDGEPRMSGKIVFSEEYIDLFMLGKIKRPFLSIRFPAQYISTELEWEDLILHEQTVRQIKDLEIWIEYNEILKKDPIMGKRIKPGYRALFHGPSGTGKTLTATLLGKYTGREVYRIDLSMVVSKFIGETEKNLNNLFAKAESKNWILFFDEADALFGKRTNVKDAHDKYANQEISYLLQRIEEYDGLIILASNFKTNIDDAFIRRFQSIIHFPQPKTVERIKLWNRSFPNSLQTAGDVDIRRIAKKYELTGANIINVVQYCALQAISKQTNEISMELIEQGIRKEIQKSGRAMP